MPKISLTSEADILGDSISKSGLAFNTLKVLISALKELKIA